MSTAWQLHQNGDCAGSCVVCDFQDNCEHAPLRTSFVIVLNAADWWEFNALLDREPVENPRLRELLNRPTRLDKDAE